MWGGSRSETILLVPDFSGSFTAADAWRVDGRPFDVMRGLVAASCEAGGRVEGNSELSAEIAFGSRFRYRMLGFLASPTCVPVHMTLTVEVDESKSDRRVRAAVRSDQGWYLWQPGGLAEQAFASTSTVRLSAVRAAST